MHSRLLIITVKKKKRTLPEIWVHIFAIQDTKVYQHMESRQHLSVMERKGYFSYSVGLHWVAIYDTTLNKFTILAVLLMTQLSYNYKCKDLLTRCRPMEYTITFDTPKPQTVANRCCVSSGSALFAKTKSIFRERNRFFEIINSIYQMSWKYHWY